MVKRMAGIALATIASAALSGCGGMAGLALAGAPRQKDESVCDYADRLLARAQKTVETARAVAGRTCPLASAVAETVPNLAPK